MTAPWFLEALGLPAHADEFAVRRAYAIALRQVDPASAPEAFARLRSAYEAARAWCEQASDTTTGAPDVEPAVAVHDASGEGDGTDAPAPEDAPTIPVDHTATLAWRFAADVGARRADAIPQMLDGTLAELRTQYIDAPGQFEEILIDLMGNQRIAHRPEVFAAAETRFHWSEVGHLAALGQRGRWIELVLAQREAWLTLVESRRQDWLALFTQAEARLDASLLPRWPEAAKLNERWPAWIGLHVSDETLQAWEAAFDGQSPSAREVYLKLTPPESAYLPAPVSAAQEKAHRRSTSRVMVGFLVALFLGIVHFATTGLPHGARVSMTSPLSMPLPSDTPQQCVELYARLDKPDAFAGRADVEIAQLEARAYRCERAGHWHAPMTTL